MRLLKCNKNQVAQKKKYLTGRTGIEKYKGSVGDKEPKMNMKIMIFVLLFLAACAVKADLGAGASTIISGNALYARKLNDFLEQAVGINQQWKLCYRASADGWAALKFHKGCDGKPDTVTIIKVGDSVFGGYADTPWDSTGTYGSSSKAFIFSLNNREDLGLFKSEIKTADQEYAIYKDEYFGPTFGRGYDIQIDNYANQHNDSYTEFGNSYTVPGGVIDRRTILAGSYEFSPNELEVFYLA